MSCDYDPSELISRKKLVQKILRQIDRFAWSELEGRYVLDMRSPVVFLSDIIKIIEGKGE